MPNDKNSEIIINSNVLGIWKQIGPAVLVTIIYEIKCL